MARILAIDVGSKRVGLAVTDPLGISAQPLETVLLTELYRFLEGYLAREEVSLFVVGEPRDMQGTHSLSWPQVKGVIRHLQKQWPSIGVVLQDERFTSLLAHRAMLAGGLRRMQRRDKSLVDRLSASLILQGYLERKEMERDVR